MPAALYADVASKATGLVCQWRPQNKKKSDAVLDWCGGPAPEIVRKVTDPELCEAPTGVEKGSATEREGGMPAKKLIKFAAPKPLVEAAVG